MLIIRFIYLSPFFYLSMYIFVFSLSLCANYLWVFLLQKIMICVHYIGKRQYYFVLCCLHCCLVGLDCMIIFPLIRTEIKHASTRTHGTYCDLIGYFRCRAIQNLKFPLVSGSRHIFEEACSRASLMIEGNVFVPSMFCSNSDI